MRHLWRTNVEDQTSADERIPELLKIPAKVRLLSVEPLLGPVDLGANRGSHDGAGLCWDCFGSPVHIPHCDYAAIGKQPPKGRSIDWVIVGGESGPRARPCNIAWIRDIVRQCQAAGVPVFVKQLGSFVIEEEGSQRKRILFDDTNGGDPAEWPEDLRVREIPKP